VLQFESQYHSFLSLASVSLFYLGGGEDPTWLCRKSTTKSKWYLAIRRGLDRLSGLSSRSKDKLASVFYRLKAAPPFYALEDLAWIVRSLDRHLLRYPRSGDLLAVAVAWEILTGEPKWNPEPDFTVSFRIWQRSEAQSLQGFDHLKSTLFIHPLGISQAGVGLIRSFSGNLSCGPAAWRKRMDRVLVAGRAAQIALQHLDACRNEVSLNNEWLPE
jgi:hypothetical protein